MSFCRKCGTEIKEGKLFCTKCGNPVSKGVEVLNSQTSSRRQNNIAHIYKNLSKKQKITTIIIGCVVIFGIIAFSIGESLTSKKNVVSKVTQAINSKNIQQAAKYITSSDSNLKIETKQLEDILDYLDKNSSYKEEVIKSMENQCFKIDSNNNSNVSYTNTNDLFTLKKQGKKWLLFDNYVVEIKPVYLNLSTNYKGTEIYLDGELIWTVDGESFTKKFGPYIPGKFNVKAVLKSENGNLEKSSEVNLISMEGTVAEIPLNLYGYTSSSNSEDVQESLMNAINLFNKDDIKALEARDVSIYTNVSGKMKQKLSEQIQKLIQDKQYYTGDIKNTIFDLDSIKTYMKDSKKYAEIKDQEEYERCWYNEGSNPSRALDHVKWTYTLVYDDVSKKWLIDDYTKGDYFNPIKKKEFNF